MKDEILEALRGSVKKWSLIVHLNGEDNGCDNCPLCKLFWKNGFLHCYLCPIVTHGNGEISCEKTPYSKWNTHHKNRHTYAYNHYTIKCPECRRLAQEELMFLQSVLERYKEEVV